jgi:O-antigen/teichoic acid export membrane protein
VTQRILTAGLGVAALAAGASVSAVAVMFVVGSVAALAVAATLLRRYVGRGDLDVAPSRWRALLQTALPLGLTGVFATVLFRIDVALLAALDSDEAVGEYGAAYRLFEATLFISWSVGAATYPVFSRLTRSTEPPVGRVFQSSLKLILAATLPLAAAGVIFGERLAVLAYGEAFDDAGDALRILAPTIAFFGVSYIAGYLIVAQDRQQVWTVVYGSVALLNIAANLVLIPAFSLHGAAAVTAASEVVVAAALGAIAVRTVGGIAWGRTLFGPLLATAAAVGVALALSETLIPALLAAAFVYAAALVAFERLVFPEDTRIVFDLVRRKPVLVGGAVSEQTPPVG